MESPQRVKQAAKLENVGRSLIEWPSPEDLPLVPRPSELARLGRLLGDLDICPVLVAESGAGKTALFTMLGHAVSLARTQDPLETELESVRHTPMFESLRSTPTGVPAWLEGLAHREFLSVTAISIAKDCFYTYNLENKLDLVVQACRETNTCLVVEDIHLLATAGASGADPASTVANLLLPHVGERGFQIAGTTTPAGWAHLERFAPELVGRLHRHSLPETAREETMQILEVLMQSLAASRDCAFAPGLPEHIFELADRFSSSKALPGRAVDLLRLTVNRETGDPLEDDAAGECVRTITRDGLVSVVAARTGLRTPLVDNRQELPRRGLASTLHRRIVGQAQAIATVVDRVIAYRAGLTDPRRPPAVLLFAGPSGVGKTELTLALTELLFGSDTAVLRYDMSEFRSGDAIERFIGTANGRGLRTATLVEKLRANPAAVILLDEIEKAHPAIWTLFLQAFADGAQLTSADGQVASFRNAFIVMTTNIGADLFRNAGSFGFAPTGDTEVTVDGRLEKRLREVFSPEFLNRISRTVMFQPLSREDARRIANLEIQKACRRAARRGIAELSVSQDLVDVVLQRGYSHEFGARPLQRAVEDLVLAPVAQLLCESPTSANQPIRVCLQAGVPTATSVISND